MKKKCLSKSCDEILPPNGNIIDKTAQVDAGSVIKNSKIGRNVVIEASFVEESVIEDGAHIGPYAHLRPNSHIGKNCKIGSFCETKNCKIGDGTKMAHLAYVGDATIGKNCNIGCGVIFANYNGRQKNKIQVGDNVFVGSNSNLIAPLCIASNVYICAGTTVTKDLKEYDFVIARSRETIKPGRAKDYLKLDDK